MCPQLSVCTCWICHEPEKAHSHGLIVWATSAAKNRIDPPAQFREECLLKTGMALQPGRVAWGGVRQGNECRRVQSPCLCSLSQRRLAAVAQKVALRMLSDEQCQFYRRQFGEQLIQPQFRALATWRQVTTLAPAWIAITHRDDRDACFFVKVFLANPHPRAQMLTTRIVPGNASFVHARAGRLTDDENTG